MPTQYPLTSGELASNCYPADPQTLYNEMFNKGFVTIDLEGVIISQSAPAATDRDKLWIKVNASSQPVGRFLFQGGLWIWPHEIPANDQRIFLYGGSTASVNTLDGGTAGTVGDSSGPFWQTIAAFDGRVPIGAGTIPGRTLAPTSTVVGDNIGEAEHTQTVDELVSHNHGPPDTQPTTDVDRDAGNLGIGLDSANQFPNADATWTDNTGGGNPFNIIQPARAVLFIQRTARIYITG